MAEVDEFLVFLLVGLFLLGLGLLIISSMAPAEMVKKNVTVFESGFDAAYLSKAQGIDLGSKKLFNGLFFGSNEVRQHVEAAGVEKLSISFSVAGTNNLAPLEIKINDKKAGLKSYAVGDYSLDVPKELLSDRMDIEIKPWSSLWKIWAPNQYTLKNVRLEMKSLSFGKKELSFLASTDNFDEARLEFVLDNNIGSTKIELNDKEVFSGFMKNQQSIDIKKEDLKSGENRLEIIPSRNSKLSGVTRVVVFSQAPRPAGPAEQPARFRSLSMFEADP